MGAHYIPDRDGSGEIIEPIRRITSIGWKAQFHCVRISTSVVGGVYNKNKSGQDLGFTTHVLKDAQGNTTTNPAQAVKTIVTWEPNHNIHIIAGKLLQAQAPNGQAVLYVTNAPDIPAQYGGSVPFSEGGLDLRDVPAGGQTDFDGRAAKYINYDPANHSGKWEFQVNHDAGLVHSFTILLEFFRP